MPELAIIHLLQFPTDGLRELVAESEMFGFRFVRRLTEEWRRGHNRFDQPGETLVAAVCGGRIVGVCGLNADPYTVAERIGRVRHLYVLSEFRRRGVGGALVRAIVAAARGRFDVLRLRTDSEAAAQFYEALGFRSYKVVTDSTHFLDLADVT